MVENNTKNGAKSTKATLATITHTVIDKASQSTVATTTTLPPEVMNQNEAERDTTASALLLESDITLENIQDLPKIVHDLLSRPGESSLTRSGDVYIHFNSNIYGSAIGGDIHQSNIALINEWNTIKSNIDFEKLSTEFSALIEAMKQKATDSDQFKQIGEIAVARDELKKADGPAMLKHLKKGGKFALQVAKEVGLSLLRKILTGDIADI